MLSRYILLILLLLCTTIFAEETLWKKVDDGLYYGHFLPKKKELPANAAITIVKIDPQKYTLKLLCASEQGEPEGGITVPKWVKKYKLLGAVNAGMYQTDFMSNVGYMQNYSHLNNKHISSKYQSFALFNPKSTTTPPFKMIDSDLKDIKKEMKKYNTVIQNLRLIRAPGTNRWGQQAKKWSEVALGIDREGNMLWIFSRYPYTMHDFNKHLLSFNIGIVAAHHLEGGPEASLYLNHKGVQIAEAGSYETSFNENDDKSGYWAVPNVIGIVKK